MNGIVCLFLAQLADTDPITRVIWAIRRPALGHLLGGPRSDQLEERGKLGSRVRRRLDEGRVELMTNFRIDRVAMTAAGIVASSGTTSTAARLLIGSQPGDR